MAQELIPRLGHKDVFTYDVIPEEDDVNKIPIPKQARNAMGPHIYNKERNDRGLVIGYQKLNVTASDLEAPPKENTFPPFRTVYPKVLRREATKAEIKQREADLTLEMWLDRDFDLIKETGLNQRKRASDWRKWIDRPVETTVKSREEEEEILTAS
jgi:hypothetical protein